MNQNWIVENLNNAFSTWNGKLTELWGLVTTSPQTFKGGAVWGVMQSLHNAMIGIDRFTFAEITHNTAAHKYDAIIYLDERVTKEEKRANTAAMRKAFDAWLEENGLTADPIALTEVPDPCEGRFDTLAGAIAHIDHILRFPDLLLII